MAWSTHNRHNIVKSKNGFICSLTVFRPVSYMLFRPEEVDTASCIRPIFRPLIYRNINISANIGRNVGFNYPITNFNSHCLTTIQARCVYLNKLTGENPADCQGFKSSLCKPFLVSVNCYTILCGQIVEWCE